MLVLLNTIYTVIVNTVIFVNGVDIRKKDYYYYTIYIHDTYITHNPKIILDQILNK